MRADALARAQEPKPVQVSRLPPMPKPLPQARQPLPAVDIAEWTFAEPVVEIRQSSSKAPAKVADPFEGGVAAAAAKPEARSSAAEKPAAKRGAARSRTATKTAAAKTAAAADPAPAKTASDAPAKPARKTAARRTKKADAES
ncbi:hypothetical protein AVE30378_05056 [Achromobacter veterisilvae]|uniref:Uncharacterized protein n=1 Tax=Achromobacter veterisilvae TaxID=2069367 RepID=A0A446CWU3_9BURK|nr:hypothetical protein AVE30378_05056 [Achromobacter veterisilvae]